MQRINRRLGRAALGALGAALIGLPATATADPSESWPDTPTLDGARVVSDHQLADMRGRFTTGNRVIRFGLEMVSRLQSSTGAALEGRASLDIDMSGHRPEVAFVPSACIGSRCDKGTDGDHTGKTVPSGEPGNDPGGRNTAHNGTGNSGHDGDRGADDSGAEGIVQQIQVAGDGNRAGNAMRIEVVEQVQEAASADGGSDTTATMLGANGSSVQVSAGADGMAIKLDIPGAGTVTQRIASGAGMKQLIRLKNNLNQASSSARLRVQLREEFPNGTGSTRRALDTLRTLR